MKPDALSAAEPEKLKVIYGWYIYVILYPAGLQHLHGGLQRLRSASA